MKPRNTARWLFSLPPAPPTVVLVPAALLQASRLVQPAREVRGMRILARLQRRAQPALRGTPIAEQARLRRLDLVGQVLCAGGDSRPQSAGPDARAPRARFAVRSHEASSRPALACSSAMRVSSTRDLMSSLRNT
jgi:hypothetical protein